MLKGPTAAFMAWAGQPLSSDGIAAAYEGLIDGLVADEPTGRCRSCDTDVLMDTSAPEPRVADRDAPVRGSACRAVPPMARSRSCRSRASTEAKQRLAGGLAAGPRRALVEAMFSDVLVALRRVTRTRARRSSSAPTGAAQRIAGGYGAEVLDDAASRAQRGRAAGHRAGARAREPSGSCSCPATARCSIPRRLEELLARPAPGALGADRPRPPRHRHQRAAADAPASLAPAFGPGSCERHAPARERRRSAARGRRDLPSLALDVDTPEDLEALATALAATHGGAAHTRGHARRSSPAARSAGASR